MTGGSWWVELPRTPTVFGNVIPLSPELARILQSEGIVWKLGLRLLRTQSREEGPGCWNSRRAATPGGICTNLTVGR